MLFPYIYGLLFLFFGVVVANQCPGLCAERCASEFKMNGGCAVLKKWETADFKGMPSDVLFHVSPSCMSPSFPQYLEQCGKGVPKACEIPNLKIKANKAAADSGMKDMATYCPVPGAYAVLGWVHTCHID